MFHCHGCGLGGDVFQFIELLLHCTFRQAVKHLAKRAGITIDGFRPSPDLQRLVAEQRAQRDAKTAFARFCDQRVALVSAHYRSLSRSATWAETFLRTAARYWARAPSPEVAPQPARLPRLERVLGIRERPLSRLAGRLDRWPTGGQRRFGLG